MERDLGQASWKQFFIIVCLFQLFSHPCQAENNLDTRQDVLLSDLRTAPRVWVEGLKSLGHPTELMILGGSATATVVTWQFRDEITRWIKRQDSNPRVSAIGDAYGTAVNYGLAQFGIYLLGVGIKNDKIREFGILTTHSAIVTSVLTVALKGMINTERPNGNSMSRFDSSFPSGHAAGTAALAGTIHRRYGILYAVPFQLASLFSGLSRIADNMHRPHEVVAGWGLGYAVGYAVAMAWEEVRFETNHFSLIPWSDPEANISIGLSLRFRF